jgi:small subunit ribosomal protein S16
MAVSIRLRREGAKNSPYYKVVVADKRSPRDGKFIEIIGTYDPKKPGRNSTLEIDRVEYWISKGAQPSDTVRSLIKKSKKAATGEPSPGAEQESSQSVQEVPSHAAAESPKPTQEESSPPAESSA